MSFSASFSERIGWFLPPQWIIVLLAVSSSLFDLALDARCTQHHESRDMHLLVSHDRVVLPSLSNEFQSLVFACGFPLSLGRSWHTVEPLAST